MLRRKERAQQAVYDRTKAPRDLKYLNLCKAQYQRATDERLAYRSQFTLVDMKESSLAQARKDQRKLQTQLNDARVWLAKLEAELDEKISSKGASPKETDLLRDRVCLAKDKAAVREHKVHEVAERVKLAEQRLEDARLAAKETQEAGAQQAAGQEEAFQIKTDKVPAGQLTEKDRPVTSADESGLADYIDEEDLEAVDENIDKCRPDDGEELAEELRRLRELEAEWPQTSASDSPDHIDAFTELEGPPVIHAIAALIVGIYHYSGLKLGIASGDLQQMARYANTDSKAMACLTSPRKMVIPILLGAGLEPCGEEDVAGHVEPAEDFQAGEKAAVDSQPITTSLGHWVLVVASREGCTVALKFMNSLPPLGPENV
ncbi:MAG: hypothetical protein Q9191_008356, partial [Dirinaria sp. TL-2023a]